MTFKRSERLLVFVQAQWMSGSCADAEQPRKAAGQLFQVISQLKDALIGCCTTKK